MCAHCFFLLFLRTAVEEISLRCNVSICVRKGMCHFQKKKTKKIIGSGDDANKCYIQTIIIVFAGTAVLYDT